MTKIVPRTYITGFPKDSYVMTVNCESTDTWSTRRIKELVNANPPQSFEDAVKIFQQVELEILVKRQRKYGKNNIKAHGLFGVVVRMEDKLSRLTNYFMTKLSGVGDKNSTSDVEDSLDDSFLDASNYARIGLMYAWGMWDLPLEEDIIPTEPIEKPSVHKGLFRSGRV